MLSAPLARSRSGSAPDHRHHRPQRRRAQSGSGSRRHLAVPSTLRAPIATRHHRITHAAADANMCPFSTCSWRPPGCASIKVLVAMRYSAPDLRNQFRFKAPVRELRHIDKGRAASRLPISSRILRGEILNKTPPSRAWTYERSWRATLENTARQRRLAEELAHRAEIDRTYIIPGPLRLRRARRGRQTCPCTRRRGSRPTS